MSHKDKNPENQEQRPRGKRKEEKERNPPAASAVSGAAARLARVEHIIKPAPDESDTEALRKNLARQIADHVYYLRAAGENWNIIVGSLEETFGLSAENIRRVAKKKDKDVKIGDRLAAAIIGQAQILGDVSTD